MYYEHFGLNEAPFKITPDTRLFYEGGSRGDILEALVYAIASGEGMVKVVGEVGSGKTMLSRMLEVRLPDNVEIVYLANPSITPGDILFAIAVEMKVQIPPGTDRIHALHSVQEALLARHAEGRQVVCFVEEAQSMPLATLEEVRLLSNLETHRAKLLQIVLFGQPELDENLNEPSIRQLRERIVHSFYLDPLGALDVASYVSFRMRAVGYRGPDVFSKGAVKRLSRASEGLIRRVNILGDKALLAAFAENAHQVTDKHVRTAVRDSEFGRLNRRSRAPLIAAGAAVVLCAVALGVAATLWLTGRLGTAPDPAGAPLAAAPVAPGSADTTFGSVVQPVAPAVPVAAPAALTSAPDIAFEAPDVGALIPVESSAGRAAPAGPGSRDIGSAAMKAAGATAPARRATGQGPAVPGQQALAPAAVKPVTEMPAAAVNAAAVNAAAVNAAAVNAVAGTPAATTSAPATVSTAAPAAATAVTPPTGPPASSAAAPTSAPTPTPGPAPPAPPIAPASDSVAVAAEKPAPSPAVSSPATAPTAGAATRTAASVPDLSGAGPAPQGTGAALLVDRLRETRAWLQAARGEHFSIQLLVTSQARRANLEQFLARWDAAGDIKQLYVYTTNIQGVAAYGVLFNEFRSLEAAQAALAQLPASLKQHGPFVRNIRDINALG